MPCCGSVASVNMCAASGTGLGQRRFKSCPTLSLVGFLTDFDGDHDGSAADLAADASREPFATSPDVPSSVQGVKHRFGCHICDPAAHASSTAAAG